MWGSIPGIASHARVPLADVDAAIKSFMGPDPYSRTKDFEGRRIEEIDGGWRLLNHGKYRGMRDDDARAMQNREAQGKRREKLKQGNQAKVSHGQPKQRQMQKHARPVVVKSGNQSISSRAGLLPFRTHSVLLTHAVSSI